MPQPLEERQDRFKRMFPPRVETLVKTLKLLGNCTNKSNYDWNQDLVKRAWIEIAKKLQDTAGRYDMDLTIHLNGDEINTLDTAEPLFK